MCTRFSKSRAGTRDLQIEEQCMPYIQDYDTFLRKNESGKLAHYKKSEKMKIKINYAKISTQCIYLGQVYITHIKFDFSFFGDLSCWTKKDRKYKASSRTEERKSHIQE